MKVEKRTRPLFQLNETKRERIDSVNAGRQEVPEDIAYSEIRQYMSSHLQGTPCPNCQEIIAKELGHALFYSAALCNLTGLSLEKVMQRENKAVSTLGYYYLT